MNPNEAFGADSNNNKLVDKLERGELSSFYEQTNASFEKGFLLRFMMSLFGNWSRREDRGSNTVDMIAMLQQLSVVKDEVTDQDMIVHEKIIALISSFTNDANGEAKSEPRLRAERVRPSVSVNLNLHAFATPLMFLTRISCRTFPLQQKNRSSMNQ